MKRKAGCQVGGGENGRGRVQIPRRGRARLGFVGTRPSRRYEKGKQGKAGGSEEPEEPGLRSERVQSSLPPRYPGEINGKNREPAGEGRGGRTGCEVRTDVEGRGPGEKGRPRKGQGRRRLFARALAGPGCLPGCARPRPSARALPHRLSRLRGGSGEIPSSGTFGTRASVQPMHSQNPGVHSRAVLTVSPASPPDAPQNTGATRTHITPLLSPNGGPGSQGTLTQRAVHQREPNGQSVHKGEALQGRSGARRRFP